VLNPKKKYNLQYYLDLTDKIVGMGCHIIGIKDMAGVLKPKAATLLVGSIRKKFPNIPIHVHTHDSAGTGVASMVACAQAGADAVDSATDSMSGMTSQPSIGAILASLEGSEISTGLDAHQVRAIDSYWAQTRLTYSPFEAGLTGPDSGKSLSYVHPLFILVRLLCLKPAHHILICCRDTFSSASQCNVDSDDSTISLRHFVESRLALLTPLTHTLMTYILTVTCRSL